MPKARSSVANVFRANAPSINIDFSTVGNQNPVSVGGLLVNTGATANGGTFMQVSGGICIGTNVGTGYDDSYAHAPGFASGGFRNYYVELTVGLAAGLPNDGLSREIELHFQSNSDNSSGFKTYEIDLSYIQTPVPLVRWNGTFGDFTVAAGGFGLQNPIANNDVIRGEWINNVLALYQNTVSCGSVNVATDANIGGTLYTGDPGIGAFIRPGANNSDFRILKVKMGTL